jgi:hypothetical protein
LKFCHVKGLGPTNVASFYTNLTKAYNSHDYQPNNIWNCDKSRAKVKKNRCVQILAGTNSKSMHLITPYDQKWLFMLCYINIVGQSLPNFYIFEGKKF